jgi:cell division inhibitor SepF
MAGTLRKTMLYLGLADDRGETEEQEYMDEYDETDGSVEEYAAPVTPIGRSSTVREMRPVQQASSTDLRRIVTVHPRSYKDALSIGDAFRAGTPVIINLSDMDEADAKRLVDFSAGLTFGLRGAIERVTKNVFLLSPEHVEVTGEDHPQPPGPSRANLYDQS